MRRALGSLLLGGLLVTGLGACTGTSPSGGAASNLPKVGDVFLVPETLLNTAEENEANSGKPPQFEVLKVTALAPDGSVYYHTYSNRYLQKPASVKIETLYDVPVTELTRMPAGRKDNEDPNLSWSFASYSLLTPARFGEVQREMTAVGHEAPTEQESDHTEMLRKQAASTSTAQPVPRYIVTEKPELDKQMDHLPYSEPDDTP